MLLPSINFLWRYQRVSFDRLIRIDSSEVSRVTAARRSIGIRSLESIGSAPYHSDFARIHGCRASLRRCRVRFVDRQWLQSSTDSSLCFSLQIPFDPLRLQILSILSPPIECPTQRA